MPEMRFGLGRRRDAKNDSQYIHADGRRTFVAGRAKFIKGAEEILALMRETNAKRGRRGDLVARRRTFGSTATRLETGIARYNLQRTVSHQTLEHYFTVWKQASSGAWKIREYGNR